MQNLNDQYTRASSNIEDIDFDEWMALYEADPEAFEQRREQLIRTTIESAPDQHQRRLNGLQFQIDMERRRADSPLQSCMRISSMMWERFDEMRGHLNELSNNGDQTTTREVRETAPVQSAEILSFNRE